MAEIIKIIEEEKALYEINTVFLKSYDRTIVIVDTNETKEPKREIFYSCGAFDSEEELVAFVEYKMSAKGMSNDLEYFGYKLPSKEEVNQLLSNKSKEHSINKDKKLYNLTISKKEIECKVEEVYLKEYDVTILFTQKPNVYEYYADYLCWVFGQPSKEDKATQIGYQTSLKCLLSRAKEKGLLDELYEVEKQNKQKLLEEKKAKEQKKQQTSKPKR